ncbi:GNAT family N-acetyltransferase [Aequorivita marisscotiae]|uniref:GNAT family N-acetyltransferase n=1 Tax=Aequorivita marisscotiae TaxID=3040348 RepID=A0ABY8KUR4_9FLAO|nr:GNAT family N-acetyltransferase [Aequorivita sp. Ant34-E75]WGF91491.1 GNAT family N-acetyltransferase [Aequorivita sp. Ant34-E75]
MKTFNFLTEHILENNRVQLSPLHREDIDRILHFSVKEPELWEYSLQPANGLKNLQTYVDFALNGRMQGTAYPFLIFDKHCQKIAGSTRFYDYQKTHNTTQLGYTWIGNEFQGTGLNKQCKLLMLEFAFESLKLDRVEFRADAKNSRSIAAMKSIGCIEEGILRSNCASPTGRRDSIVLSILKDEWFGGVKEKLKAKIEKERNISSR